MNDFSDLLRPEAVYKDVAVAHKKALFAQLATAADDLPVDLVFMLLSPVDAGADHLKALARVSRRLRDRTFLTKLRGAGSPDALYALFTADAARDAA